MIKFCVTSTSTLQLTRLFAFSLNPFFDTVGLRRGANIRKRRARLDCDCLQHSLHLFDAVNLLRPEFVGRFPLLFDQGIKLGHYSYPKIHRKLLVWCPESESNRYAPFTEARDFKSLVSTNFTTRATFVIVREIKLETIMEGVGIGPAYKALQAVMKLIKKNLTVANHHAPTQKHTFELVVNILTSIHPTIQQNSKELRLILHNSVEVIAASKCSYYPDG